MCNAIAEIIDSHEEIEQLLSRAGSIITAYESAANCEVLALDSKGRALDFQKNGTRDFLCRCCGKHCQDKEREEQAEDLPCASAHREGIEESHRLRSSYIYMCPLGLVFWSSPLYFGGRYAGALVAGKVLGVGREEALERARSCGPGGEAPDPIKAQLEAAPQRSYEEIKAMAQMMLICAQQISASLKRGPDKGRDTIAAQLDAGGMAELQGPAGGPADTVQEGRDSLPAATRSNSNERLLIAALRRGDSAAASRILGEILDTLKSTHPGNFPFFRCRAIELVVLLSRSCPTEKESGPLLEENNLYLKRISDSATIEELEANLHRIIERMAGRIFSFQGLRHASALRRAERFIWKNYTRKVSLEEIAAASGLSAPYFSTIFREEMGEYLSAHLNRLRVVKACSMLIETNATLNAVSESCGFEDQSWFSKIFKSYTGYSPGKYREQGGMSGYMQDRGRAG
jgi:AraC-like DNA-binding protein/ligand-binding sensor protein